MEHITAWSQNGSLHAINHFVLTSYRSYSTRKIWIILFTCFVSLCCYLQVKLLYDILIVKPRSVEVFYERASSANFPNLVLCDLNHEHDRIKSYVDAVYGNSSLMHIITMELAMAELFEAVRRELRNNVSSISKYPVLRKLYKESYNYASSEYKHTSKNC